MYKYFEPNPRGRNMLRCDCSVRAICAFMNVGYNTAIDTLCDYAKRSATAPEDIINFKYIMKDLKCEYISNKGKERQTVERFCIDNPTGIFLLRCEKKHYVTVIDGVYYDCWDSGNMKVNSYFVKKF